ncbi:MAG TPA: hypothetical protein VKA30_02160, partial [Actinomycetota bacterium]|nr:hypothetical protein [Actinomycetota bacterium]
VLVAAPDGLAAAGRLAAELEAAGAGRPVVFALDPADPTHPAEPAQAGQPDSLDGLVDMVAELLG